MVSRNDGIWEIREEPRPDQATCGFCLQKVEGIRTVCPRCRAVYHADCWKANDGRCAVYGCQPVVKPLQPAAVPSRPARSGSRVSWLIPLLVIIGINIFRYGM